MSLSGLMSNRGASLNKKKTLEMILNRKEPKKSFFFQLLARLRSFFWLYFIVRKKSHRVRIKKARHVFELLQHTQFKENPCRFFAYIRAIDPFVFEELLLIAFKSRDLKVIHNKRYTGDGGIDGMVVLPSQQRIAVQAKRYQNYINVQHLKGFAQEIKNHRCTGGFFIHCGKSGSAVYDNLPDNMMLISGTNLHRLVTMAE